MITSGFSLGFNGKALLNNSKEMLWQRNIYQVTTSTDGHGTMTASPMSGFSGTNITLSNTPNANYNFANYSITGTTLTGNQFILNNDVTAQANFYQPNPLGLPDYTVRLKFKNGTNPSSAGAISPKGRYTRVSTNPNVWDVTYENSDWSYFASDERIGLIEIIGGNTTKVTGMNYAFNLCGSLTAAGFLDLSNVTMAYRMFDVCNNLLTVAKYDLHNVKNTQDMFANCRKLKYVPLFDLSNVKYASWMFGLCPNIESGVLDLYRSLSARGTAFDHSRMFYSAGANTVNGAAELAQIPGDWK